ncbi:MAG: chemotaxis protein CheX [Vallitaleaceae bacterium]|nr:chemotaxis protein CheX [Vallitaleaceae bacterium]
MKNKPSKIIAIAFSVLLIVFVILEISFLSMDQSGDLLFFIAQQIKNFFIYSGIFSSFGFLVFSFIVVLVQSRLRYFSYVFLSITLFMYSLYCLNYFYAQRYPFFEIVSFALCVFFLIISLLYRFVEHNRIRNILLLFVTTIGLGFLVAEYDIQLLYRYHEIYALVLLYGVSFYYYHSQATKEQINERRNLTILLLVVFVTRTLSFLNQQFIWFSLEAEEVIEKILPLAIGISSVVNSIFSELYQISIQVQKENMHLKTVATNIYEYVSEGVFSIAPNLLVNDTYTKICSKIFGVEISGAEVAYLIATKQEPKEYIERVFYDLFSGKISETVGRELLPQQLEIRGRFYYLSYQFVKEAEEAQNREKRFSEIIIKLIDVTDNIELENERIEERDKLSLSLTSILHREELLPLVEEFIEYIENPKRFQEEAKERLNRIHTYKGNFGVFNFIHTLHALHQLESDLIEGKEMTKEMITDIMAELYKDLEIITDVSGSDFFEDTLYLKANVKNLEDVYADVRKYFYDKEASLIVYIIKKIFRRSIKDILLFYGREARKKAMDDGKEIKTIEVVGDEVFVDYDYYKNALRALVHIFNNCIDHGIEEEEERLMAGKPRIGEISCRINDYGNFFEVIIKDDGRGVDVDSLSKKLRQQGIISEEEIQNLSEEELVEYVFHAKISTHDEASTLGGRGVGLASVKNEVEKVGGEIRLISFLDFGTEVKILLPKENENLISYFTLPLLMDLYVEAFKIFVKSNDIFELPLNVVGTNKSTRLYPYNVKIPFEGPENGYFLMSCNEHVLRHLAIYITENALLSDDEFEEIREDVLKESCNIVAGNSTSIFDLNQKYIYIKSPELIETNDEKRELEGDEVHSSKIAYSWNMMYGENGVILGIIID